MVKKKYLETNNLIKSSYITCFIQSKQHGSVWWFGPRPSASSVKINSPGLISRAATMYLQQIWYIFKWKFRTYNHSKSFTLKRAWYFWHCFYLPTSGRNWTLKGKWVSPSSLVSSFLAALTSSSLSCCSNKGARSSGL